MLFSVLKKYPKTKNWLKFLSYFGQMTEMSQGKEKLRLQPRNNHLNGRQCLVELLLRSQGDLKQIIELRSFFWNTSEAVTRNSALCRLSSGKQKELTSECTTVMT